jgi:3-methyladenine DNA glycosylase/8-oxoguanine DNA glycosylase
VPTSLTTSQALPAGHDVPRTLAALPIGSSDPCWSSQGDRRWSWATRSPDGPVTLQLTVGPDEVDVEAWGEGAEWGLGAVPRLLGLEDEAGSFSPDALIAPLVARYPGFRLAATGRIVNAAIAGVCRRGVSAFEAGRSWSLMVDAFGDDAPGPADLRLPPAPRRVAAAEPYDLHVMGLEQGRADEVRRVASHAGRLEVGAGETPEAPLDRLRTIAGLGPDAIEHARAMALGDPDAVPVVDPHHLAVVVRTLHTAADDPVDAEELLEPYRPHRGRVVRLLGLTVGAGGA